MKIRRGAVVTLKGDDAFVGVIQGVRKDKCGQIPVHWILWRNRPLHRRVWIEPYKLERLHMPPIKATKN